MLLDLDYNNPQVYIHTGNWVFESTETEEAISITISEAILKKFGWQVPIIVIASSDFKIIFNACPFSEEKKEKSYFTLLAKIPSKENLAVLEGSSFPNEEFQITESCIYFYASISAARVKMNNNYIEKKLKVSATSRNFKTMLKLIALSSS